LHFVTPVLPSAGYDKQQRSREQPLRKTIGWSEGDLSDYSRLLNPLGQPDARLTIFLAVIVARLERKNASDQGEHPVVVAVKRDSDGAWRRVRDIKLQAVK
jgi:hypothetical protein